MRHDPSFELGPSVERAIRDALTAAGEPDWHELLFALALNYAHDDQLPEVGEPLRLFVEGPLQSAIDTLFGTAIADLARAHILDALAERIAVPTPHRPSSTRQRRMGPADSDPEAEQRQTLRVKSPLEPFRRPTVPTKKVG